jgi:aminoglycoside/choline kinase family phosphotransferase
MDIFELPEPWVKEEPLAGDASTRTYSRLIDPKGNSAIMVRYPKEVAWQIERDLETRSWCELNGVRVPMLVDYRPDSDWAVVEDLGSHDADQTLERAASGERLPMVLRLAEPIAVFARVATVELPLWNQPLESARLRWELAGFELWFLRHRSKARPSEAVSTWLDGLAADIGRHPKRVCHRDFHINNLFFLESGDVGVIDFQDILVGPDTYDIVSLLHERSLPGFLDEPGRTRVMEHWARTTSADDGWKDRARQVRLQRALKVLGTFARFEAAGSTTYVAWMRALSREVMSALEAAGAPPGLTALLLDC